MSALSISIAGQGYQDMVDGPAWAGGAPSAGIWYVVPPFGDPPCEFGKEFEDLYYSFPAIPGQGRKRLDFRQRMLFASFLSVNTTRALNETAILVFEARCQTFPRYSIILPGGTTRAGCELVKGGFQSQWLPSMGGKFLCLLKCTFRQLSES